MSHMTDTDPWLARYFQLCLKPSPHPPSLNACYLQVITAVTPRRQLVVFDGQYTATAILSHSSANSLDADVDNLGVTTHNLLGHLIAPVSILIVPDISHLTPQATLVISDLRVFADRWASPPVANLPQVESAPEVLRVLRAWVGRKMASFITRDKLERGNHTGELGVGEEVEGDVRGAPGVDVVRLGEMLKEGGGGGAAYAAGVRVLDGVAGMGGRGEHVSGFTSGRGGAGAAVKMVHVGTGEGAEARGGVGGGDSEDAAWEMGFPGGGPDGDGDVEMEDGVDGGEALPQTQRFGSEDGDDEEVGGGVRDDALGGVGGRVGNLTAMVDQYWAKEVVDDHAGRGGDLRLLNAPKNFGNCTSVANKNGDNTSVRTAHGPTALDARRKGSTTASAPSYRKDRAKHMEDNHMGNMTSQTQDNPVATDGTSQDTTVHPHQPNQPALEKDTAAAAAAAAAVDATVQADDAPPANIESVSVEHPAPPEGSPPVVIDPDKPDDPQGKNVTPVEDPAPTVEPAVAGGDNSAVDPSGEPTAANGDSRGKGLEEKPVKASEDMLKGHAAGAAASVAGLATKLPVPVTSGKEAEVDTEKPIDKDLHKAPAADPETMSDPRPDTMDVDTAEPHPDAMDKDPDHAEPTAEARDVRVVEDLAIVDEVEPMVKSGTKRKGMDSAVDSEKRKVQRDAGESVAPAADGPLERLKLELDLMRKFRRAVDKDPEGYVLMPDAFLASVSEKETRRRENGAGFPPPDMPAGHGQADEIAANVPDSAPI